MDDPWGSSPWLDEAEQQTNGELSRTSAFSKSTNTATASNSPWAGDSDDGFGQWAALPVDKEEPLNGLEGWAQQEDEDQLQSVAPKLDASRSDWFHRDLGGFESSRTLQPDAQQSRRPSPDPWITGTTPTKHDTMIETVRDESLSIPDIEVLSPPLNHDADPIATSEADHVNRGLQSEEEKDGVSSAPSDQNSVPSLPANVIEDMDISATRASTSLSGSSHADEKPSESPRTSFEDEPKRPQLERQES